MRKLQSPNKKYFDLENPSNCIYFKETNYDRIIPALFDGRLPKERVYLFLDEIQNVKNLPSIAKYLIDTYHVKFFLTGSVSYYFKNLFSESLSGRKFLFELFPLDFQEFLTFKEVNYETPNLFIEKSKNKSKALVEKYKGLFEEYLIFGGFPGVVLQENEEKKKRELKDILFSYLELDVKKISHIRKISKAEDLIKLLAVRCGQKLDIKKISSESELSRQTVYEYLYYFEKTYLISLLSPYSKSPDREVSGAKKIYFVDNGILNVLAQISGGQLFENCVFNALKKYNNLNYYQRRSGAEIDFILNKHTAFEAKEKGNSYDLMKLEKYAKIIKAKEYYLGTKDFSDIKNTIWAGDL